MTPADGAVSAPPLELEGVTKRFGTVAAVSDVSLSVDPGEIVALVGPSGCGKSTLLRLVAGLLPANGGHIRLGGRAVTGPGLSVAPEKRRVGVVFQDHALFPHLTVAENIAFGLTGLSGADRRHRVDGVLELVGLGDHLSRYPHELSGGERQRVGLARALAPRPAVVLLDEPFASLDRNLRSRVRVETVEILRDAKASALFVTHDQVEALAVGDRVAVMRSGRIEQVADPDVVFHAPRSRFVATFLGEADFLPVERHGDVYLTEAGPCPPPADRAAGGHVMVRPHEVAVDADPDGDAVVVAREFQGATNLYVLRLASGQRLHSMQPHTVDLAPDTRVRVRLIHGHAPALLPPEERPAG